MLEIFSYFRWQDFVDILVVAFVIHQLITIIRGTRSVQMVMGIIILTIVYFLASVLDLATFKWIMQTFLSSILLIVFICCFSLCHSLAFSNLHLISHKSMITS